MRIAILVTGTRGDVQPVVAMGDELTRRGHQVVVAVNSDLADWVRRAGLEAVPIGTNLERFLHTEEAKEWVPRDGVVNTIRRIAVDERAVNESIVWACARAVEGADLILTTLTMSLRGICLERATGIPCRTLYAFPVQPTGDFASIMVPLHDLRLRSLNRSSSSLLNGLYWARNKANIDQMSDLLGAARLRRGPRHEERPGLHLYSEQVVPTSDLPGSHHMVGWTVMPRTLRERLGEGKVPADLDAWIDAGPPPVYFGFGSMPVRDPERMLRDLAAVTARRGLRGLVGAGWSTLGDFADGLPEHLFLAASEFDHDQTLPRCRAAVHHGGAGTAAAALRAGLPAVVASVFADQPFWGWRLERLGVGVSMPFRRLTADRLGAALDRVLAPAYRTRAREIGAAVAREDAVPRATDVVESWTRAA